MTASLKPPLLFLAHRIPYPPNKGDKIRSYHLLRYLCRHYRVYLGCFVDDVHDLQYVSLVKALCEDALFIKLNPTLARVKSLKALFFGQALTVPFYANNAMGQWVDTVLEQHGVERCVVFSSAMAQYLMGESNRPEKVVVDFVDVDSDKWLQYSQKKTWPISTIFKREAKCLLEFERDTAELADHSLFVSSAEAALFRALVPERKDQIGYYNNGVDSNYFDPDLEYDNPYNETDMVLVFTGAMDYWPNVDAVIWFTEEVFPVLKSYYPNVQFYIVGRHPAQAVKSLAKVEGVHVTGGVMDIRPYIYFSHAAIAPMRIARGVQNKVLEAMAMAKIVMASDLALEGIDAQQGRDVLLVNDAPDYLECMQRMMSGEYQALGASARVKVCRDFNWESSLPVVGELLDASLKQKASGDA